MTGTKLLPDGFLDLSGNGWATKLDPCSRTRSRPATTRARIISRRRIEFSPDSVLEHPVEGWPVVPALRSADAEILVSWTIIQPRCSATLAWTRR